MPYATAADHLIAFGPRELAQLATPQRFEVVDDADLELSIEDPDYPTGRPNEAALEACLDSINQAIASTDGLIDSYLATRYQLPLATVPAVLKEKALDLARFELQKDRATEEARRRRDDAISWLKDLAGGRAKLGVASIDSGADSTGVVISGLGGRTFTHESLENFCI